MSVKRSTPTSKWCQSSNPSVVCRTSTREGANLCRDCAAETAPIGIKVVRAVGGLFGGISLLIGIRLLGLVPPLGVVVIGLSLGQLAVLYGLWTLRTWSWGVALLLFGLGVLADLFRAVTGNRTSLAGVVVEPLAMAYIYSNHERYLPGESGSA